MAGGCPSTSGLAERLVSTVAAITSSMPALPESFLPARADRAVSGWTGPLGPSIALPPLLRCRDFPPTVACTHPRVVCVGAHGWHRVSAAPPCWGHHQVERHPQVSHTLQHPEMLLTPPGITPAAGWSSPGHGTGRGAGRLPKCHCLCHARGNPPCLRAAPCWRVLAPASCPGTWGWLAWGQTVP